VVSRLGLTLEHKHAIPSPNAQLISDRRARNAGANDDIVENRLRTHGVSGQLASAIVLPIEHGPTAQPRPGRCRRKVALRWLACIAGVRSDSSARLPRGKSNGRLEPGRAGRAIDGERPEEDMRTCSIGDELSAICLKLTARHQGLREDREILVGQRKRTEGTAAVRALINYRPFQGYDP